MKTALSENQIPSRRKFLQMSLAGTVVGLALPLSVRLFTSYEIHISPWSIVAALLVSLVVGVIFGTVPATRAAQMDPVESLKYE